MSLTVSSWKTKPPFTQQPTWKIVVPLAAARCARLPGTGLVVVTSCELSRNISTVKQAAAAEPVLITEHGRPAFVLMSLKEFQRLTRRHPSIAELLVAADSIELEPARLEINLRIPDFQSEQTSEENTDA